MKHLPYFDADQVAKRLTMPTAIAAVGAAMKAVHSKQVTTPTRSFSPLVDDSGALAFMAGSASEPPIFGAKLLSLLPDNPGKSRPAIQGFVVLFNHNTGSPLALVDGASLTAIRTAAASGLATGLLARPDVKSHGILGTGVQCQSHVDAIAAACPSIERVMIWGRDHNKAKNAAKAAAQRTGLDVKACTEARDVAQCDVVSAATGAQQPILHGAWLQSGAHVNLVGSHSPDRREADSALMTRARIYVDTMEGALREAGDLLIPLKEKAIGPQSIIGTLGQLTAGDCAGRIAKEDITLFKSLGLFAQDLWCAWEVVNAA